MNYHKKNGQMDLSDRLAIETGICHKDSLKKIAKLLGRHPSTIAHEIKENRTFIPGNYFLRKDCKFVRQHVVHHVCGDMECEQNCCRCRSFDCQKHCEKYVSRACHKFDRAPYVCNNCPEKKLCVKDKYIYSAKHADAAVSRRRSESRKGVRISDVQKAEMDELITKLVKKREDSLFEILHEDNLAIGGVPVDINPIKEGKSGTLQTYLPEAEQYLFQKQKAQEKPKRISIKEKLKGKQEEVNKNSVDKHRNAVHGKNNIDL